jgi:hypothetical protein
MAMGVGGATYCPIATVLQADMQPQGASAGEADHKQGHRIDGEGPPEGECGRSRFVAIGSHTDSITTYYGHRLIKIEKIRPV